MFFVGNLLNLCSYNFHTRTMEESNGHFLKLTSSSDFDSMKANICWISKIGLTPSSDPFVDRFSIINQPAIGVPS